MPKILKNLKVTEVSILTGDKLPANGESVIVKDADSFEIIAKADNCIDGLVYCTVMKANAEDSDGEQAEPETIKKAAHDFLKNSRAIDENHNHSTLDGCYVVQSYINEKGDWKAVFDVSENSVMLEKAKNGEITGVSIYGKAQKVEKAGKEISSKNKSVLKQAYELLAGFFKDEQPDNSAIEKGFTENITLQNWWQVVNAFTDSVSEIMRDENNKNKSTAIKKQADDFIAYISKNFTTTEIKKNKEESIMTKDELKAMLAEIATETKTTDEQVAKEKKVANLEAAVKTLTETVEKQAKSIEEIAKDRTTDTGAGTGEITMESVMKCADPTKRQEMYNKFVEKNRKAK